MPATLRLIEHTSPIKSASEVVAIHHLFILSAIKHTSSKLAGYFWYQTTYKYVTVLLRRNTIIIMVFLLSSSALTMLQHSLPGNGRRSAAMEG